MRKLASVQRISGVSPIPGKDRIALARVEGWQVVVNKADFDVGDLCVYVEIDSILPEKPEFEFLRPKGFRIRTIKLGGALSQGICFPMSILPPGGYAVGDDVTDILGVTKYEPPAEPEPPAPKKAPRYPAFLMRFAWFRRLVQPKKLDASFPSFISKTDEIRIQNIPEILENTEKSWVLTEKLDGTSASYALARQKRKLPFLPDKFEFYVCSRNRRLPEPDASVYWEMAGKYRIRDALRDMIGDYDWVAIQGECLGPRIQGNKYHMKSNDFYVFNVIYPSGRLASTLGKIRCEERGLKFVPLLDCRPLPPTVDEVLAIAHGESQLAHVLREGLVCRSIDGKDSFKAVDPLFLLEHNE